MATPASPDPCPTDRKPPRARRWIPLSLRIFVAILVLSGLGGTLIGMSLWWAYHREQQAIATIESFARDIEKTTIEPQWLRPLMSKGPKNWADVFERVTRVDLVGSEVSDANFASIGAFKKLNRLWVNETSITDAGLANIRGLTGLESLWLDNTQITDRGLPHLSGLTNLRRLSLSGTKITDEGLVHIAGLVQLRSLWLDHTEITSDGVKRLEKALPNCIISPP